MADRVSGLSRDSIERPQLVHGTGREPVVRLAIVAEPGPTSRSTAYPSRPYIPCPKPHTKNIQTTELTASYSFFAVVRTALWYILTDPSTTLKIHEACSSGEAMPCHPRLCEVQKDGPMLLVRGWMGGYDDSDCSEYVVVVILKIMPAGLVVMVRCPFRACPA